MRAAVAATAAGFAELVPLIEAGRTEREVQVALDAAFLRNGGDFLSFETIVAAGPHSAVLHFSPAQSQGVPKRIVMPSGTVLDVWKVCDFEADVGWAIGLSQRSPIHVSRSGATVTVTFGG